MTFQKIAGLSIGVFALCITSSMAQSDAAPSVIEKITQTATENRYRLDYDGTVFSGPAWETLVAQGQASQFLLIGEEHGIAENPKLAAQLFTELSDDGYENLVIETSPAMATILDQTLKADGLDGLRALFAARGGEPAFFGMHEEAELLAAARNTSNRRKPVLLGVDYEVASDPMLLQALKDKRKPKAASDALDALIAASDAAWAQYFETGGPQFIFSFSGDPALVRAVKHAWPNRDDEASWILDTLEGTLEINQLWMNRQGWQSNAKRAALLRSNFLRHWAQADKNNNAPKMMVKLGATHLVRGRNHVETFDLGTLLPELAAINGAQTTSVFVLPGAGTMTAVLDPTNWTYRQAPGKDSYGDGLDAITATAFDDAFTLIDLRPIRHHVTPRVAKNNGELARIVHGFDMLLIMTDGTPSSEFVHDAPLRQVE